MSVEGRIIGRRCHWDSMQMEALCEEASVHTRSSVLSVRSALRLARCVLLCAILSASAYAQQSWQAAAERWREAGLPYMKTYSASEYGGDQQNWGIIQDRRGVMYFANQSCLLEYDGVTWRQVYTGDRLSVRSVDIDSSGGLWMGAALEIGYFLPDAIGNLQYNSLLPHVPSRIREIADYWRAAVARQTIYMQTRNFLLRFDPNSASMTTVRSESGFDKFIMLGNTLYIRKNGVGLMSMEGDSLRLIPGGERFADMSVSALLPFTNSAAAPDAASEEIIDRPPKIQSDAHRFSFLAVTRTHGLFLYDGASFQPFITEADAILRQANVLSGAVLTDGSFALGTDKSGVVVIGRHGQQQLTLNLTTGLPGNSVYCMYVDSQGGLWLGTNKGLVRVEFPSPLSLHTGSLAFRNGVNLILRHQEVIYLATSEGLYKMGTGARPGAPADFREIPVPGEKVMFGHMATVGDRFFAATAGSGLLQIKDDRFERMPAGGRVDVSRVYFMRSRYNPDRIYLGVATGLGFLELRNGTWKLTGQIPNFHENVNEITEESPGVLWLTSRLGKAFRVELPSLHLSPPSGFLSAKIERFDEAHGVPKGWIRVLTVNGKVLFATHKGLRRFDPASRTFQLEASFGKFFADSAWNTGGGFFHDDDRGRMWTSRFYNNKTEVGVAIPKPNGGYAWYTEPFRRFADFGEIWNFYIDEKHKGVYWFGGADGAIRYDETIAKNYSAGYPALIRRVIVNGDSMIYGGAYSDPISMMKTPVLTFENNTLRFECAVPYLDKPEANQYQYFLDGFDHGWSPWMSETFVDYRQLPEGRYRFHVRARNVYQNVGDEAAFALEILPPWYRTLWAYALYGVIFIGAIAYGAASYNRYKTREQEKELARQRQINDRLRRVDKLKDEFLANTSHELRTPLHGIIGIAESLLDGAAGELPPEAKSNLAMVVASGKRLTNQVNDILDFSRLKRSDLRLQKKPVDIRVLADVVLKFSEPLLAGKKLVLRNEIPKNLPPVDGDENRLQQILHNLVGNAVKFTESGSITVSAAENDGMIEVSVSDTGIGVAPEKFDTIFQSFEQADASTSREYGGTGLGLAITKQLVELHGGEIWIESEVGKGSTFTFSLPKSDGVPATGSESAIDSGLARVREVESEVMNNESSSLPQTRPPQQSETKDGEFHILVVDDEPVNQQVLANHLSQVNYALTQAFNGEEALRRLEADGPFDLVLLDIMMPRMSGYEVCQKIREKYLPNELPVIMVTAKNQVEDLLEGLASGANDYLAKPFSKAELLARIKTHLNLFNINSAYGRFVPHEFLRALGHESIIDVKLGDQIRQEMTVLFSDIRDYSSLSESMTPRQNFRFLNAYLRRVGPVITANQGFVNQYYGDGIMALFSGSADAAVQASIDIQRVVEKYNQQREKKGRRRIEIGVGLNTGSMMMGILGDQKRLNAGVVSDAVNTAARMEGLTKFYGAPIVISEQTFSRIEQTEKLTIRRLGNVQVRGKREAVAVYEVIDGNSESVQALKIQTKDDFETGLGYYFARDFAAAAHHFQQVIAVNANDKAAQIYLERSLHLQEHGTPEIRLGVEANEAK